MRRGLRVVLAATVIGALPVAFSGLATAAPTRQAPMDTIPSQGQVDAAKAAVDVAAGSVAQIEAAYAAASTRLSELQVEAGMAAAVADSARALLAERARAADTAATAARKAAEDRAKADRAVRRTAAQIYQEQGAMAGMGAYLESGGPQELADRSAVLAVVGDLRQQALQSAATSANAQAEAERTAALAKSQQDAAAHAADQASAAANDRARAAAEEAARIRSEQEQRIAALAAAQSTSVELERARVEGLARQAAEAEAARRAQEQAAEAARVAAQHAAEEAARAEAARRAAQQGSQPASPSAPSPAPAGSGYSTTAYSQAYLQPNANALYSAIRTLFGIWNIGGYRAGDPQDHGTGRAIDVMTSSFAEGDAVAAWTQAHSGEFGVKYIIWKQRIWFPGNGPDQWRWMEDRGSITQNHYDHVHISVY